jgi:hypothetical protein
MPNLSQILKDGQGITQGPQGIQGPTHIQGTQGILGTTGTQGIVGVRGTNKFGVNYIVLDQ